MTGLVHPVPCVAEQVGVDSLGRPRRRLPTVCKIARSVIVTEDGCWQNTAGLSDNGYAKFDSQLAHRFVYQMLVGPIPEALQLDHLCRNRACCNPAHLEPVTPSENARRGLMGDLTTHCPAGHAYDEFGVRRDRGTRDCRECGRLRARSLRKRPCTCANGRCRDCRARAGSSVAS